MNKLNVIQMNYPFMKFTELSIKNLKKKILNNLHVAYHSTIFDKCIPEKHVLTILTI